MKTELATPVALLIFNRPDTAEKVYEAIRNAKPKKLLVVADGPRADRPGEAEKCSAARAIIDRVDWPCEVLKNYSDVNLGCKLRVSSGLNWVFETVEESIILEDDCLPHPTFFRFCEELLGKYRSDERISLISGVNYQFGRKRTNDSYYFSRYNHIWGWASWRRAWKNYDVTMKLWPEVRDGNWLYDKFGSKKLARYWTALFDKAYQGQVNTWDFQWTFSCWVHNTLSILPNVNLISNIGFGGEATHTKNGNLQISNMKAEPMLFPLRHPSCMIRDARADDLTHSLVYDYRIKAVLQRKIKELFFR